MSTVEPEDRRKVGLVVHDGKSGPTATQMISFGHAFARTPEAPFRIAFEGHRADTAEIEAAFDAQQPDVLILSRYTSERGSDWVALARQAGIPVIFHLDDDLLAVPESLGTAKFKAYNSPERLKALRDNIEASDLCYVSTEELGRRMEDHGISIPIIAGEIYCSVSADEVGAFLPPATAPVIGYMGTAGHSADLAMILPAICQMMELVPGLNVEIFGTIKMPPELARFGTRVRHLPSVADYAQFRSFLRSLGWWVGLAPLEDNAFNRCKADTKWVEYSLAGMAVIASDLPVYQRACADGAGVLATGCEDWAEAAMRLIHRPDYRASMIERAQNKLRERYTHDRLRRQVIEIFGQAARPRLRQLPSPVLACASHHANPRRAD